MTSFEDLPADLFGEDDTSAPEDDRPGTRGWEDRVAEATDGDAAASRTAARPVSRASGSSGAAPSGGDGSGRAVARTRPPAAGGQDGESTADPALDTVQRLFPGRVIAFQPFEEADADGEAASEGEEVGEAPVDAAEAEPAGADAPTEA